MGVVGAGLAIGIGGEKLGTALRTKELDSKARSIKVTVLYDGMQSVDTNNVQIETITLAGPAILQDLIDAVVGKYPALRDMFPFMNEWVNGNSATQATPLSEGDEVQFVAPFAGG